MRVLRGMKHARLLRLAVKLNDRANTGINFFASRWALESGIRTTTSLRQGTGMPAGEVDRSGSFHAAVNSRTTEMLEALKERDP